MRASILILLTRDQVLPGGIDVKSLLSVSSYIDCIERYIPFLLVRRAMKKSQNAKSSKTNIRFFVLNRIARRMIKTRPQLMNKSTGYPSFIPIIHSNHFLLQITM